MKMLIIVACVAAVACVYWFSTKKRAVTMIDPNELRFSQLDITERFDDRQRLKKDDWVQTTALNVSIPNPESRGLPPKDATPDAVYEVGARLSALREKFSGLGDGVYCPVCHIANIDPSKLRTPCPKCGRKLLRFGWD